MPQLSELQTRLGQLCDRVTEHAPVSAVEHEELLRFTISLLEPKPGAVMFQRPCLADGLTDAQRHLIELDRKKTEVKKFYEDYDLAVRAVVEEGGVGCHFQDEEGVVYQVTEPEGKFVYFEKFHLDRTRRKDEKKGDLSLTKARELGYSVEGK